MSFLVNGILRMKSTVVWAGQIAAQEIVDRVRHLNETNYVIRCLWSGTCVLARPIGSFAARTFQVLSKHFSGEQPDQVEFDMDHIMQHYQAVFGHELGNMDYVLQDHQAIFDNEPVDIEHVMQDYQVILQHFQDEPEFIGPLTQAQYLQIQQVQQMPEPPQELPEPPQGLPESSILCLAMGG